MSADERAAALAAAEEEEDGDDGDEEALIPGSLRGVPVPLPDLSGVIRDQQAAIALGKALFWDQQLGSDDMACASCHFHAGADIRLTNQLSPGLLDGDTSFGAIAPAAQLGKTASGASAGPNYALVAADVPFHQLTNPLDRNSAIVISSNDVASSAGAYGRAFLGVNPGAASDICGPADASVFHAGALRASGGQGLSTSDEALIEAAFAPAYWSAAGAWTIDGSGNLVADANGFTHKEINFSLYFGPAVMLYEATLISDDTPFDRYVGCTAPGCGDYQAPDPQALSAQERAGLEVFLGKGKCINCHKGPEFSGAASVLQAENDEDGLVERMAMGDGAAALYDNGFYNIGVRPSSEDPGVGGAGRTATTPPARARSVRAAAAAATSIRISTRWASARASAPRWWRSCSRSPTLAWPASRRPSITPRSTCPTATAPPTSTATAWPMTRCSRCPRSAPAVARPRATTASTTAAISSI